jgi:hypothetical protein
MLIATMTYLTVVTTTKVQMTRDKIPRMVGGSAIPPLTARTVFKV